MQYQTSSRTTPTKLHQTNSNTILQLDNEDFKTNIVSLESSEDNTNNNNTNNNSSDPLLINDDSIKTTNENDEVNYSSFNHQNVLIEKHGGLSNRHVLAILSLWYFFSALTLFTNKYIVSQSKGDPTLLG
jgi:hypothetical protein